jgi:hypothetical protein
MMVLILRNFPSSKAKLMRQKGANCAACNRLINGSNGSLEHRTSKGPMKGPMGTFMGQMGHVDMMKNNRQKA